MTRLFISLALALVFAGPARAQDNPVVAAVERFVAAYNAGDAATVASLYTEDGVLFPPDMGHLAGRARIGELYTAAFTGGAGNLRYNILEIRGHGPDAAVEIGEMIISAGGRDMKGRTMHVWRLVNGQWLLSRDIYNIIGPAQ